MEELEKFRESLNRIDGDLIRLLGERFEIIEQVGQYKRTHDIAMMQPKRVDEVKDRCAKLGENYGLNGDFIRSLYTVIINEACRLEDIIIDES